MLHTIPKNVNLSHSSTSSTQMTTWSFLWDFCVLRVRKKRCSLPPPAATLFSSVATIPLELGGESPAAQLAKDWRLMRTHVLMKQSHQRAKLESCILVWLLSWNIDKWETFSLCWSLLFLLSSYSELCLPYGNLTHSARSCQGVMDGKPFREDLPDFSRLTNKTISPSCLK